MPSAPMPPATDRPTIVPVPTPPPPPLSSLLVDVEVAEVEVVEDEELSVFVEVYVTTGIEVVPLFDNAVEPGADDVGGADVEVGADVEAIDVVDVVDGVVLVVGTLSVVEVDVAVVDVVVGVVLVVVVDVGALVSLVGSRGLSRSPARGATTTFLLSSCCGDGRRLFPCVSGRAMTSAGATRTRSERGTSRMTARQRKKLEEIQANALVRPFVNDGGTKQTEIV